jgi:hypothetical protein
MRQAYRAILRLYPAEHRSMFAPEMMETFDEAAADWRKRGSAAYICFSACELTGLLSGLITEWISKWTARDSYITSRCLSKQESNQPTEIVEIEKRLQRLIGCMEFAIANHDFPKARLYSDEERIVRAQLHRVMREYKLNEPAAPPAQQKKSNGYA